MTKTTEKTTEDAPKAKAAPKASLLTKISAKTITGLEAREIKAAGRKERTVLYHVAGIAREEFKGMHATYGEFQGLKGNFLARAEGSEREYRSGKLFLPAVAHLLIAGNLTGEVGSEIRFGFTIGVEPDATADQEFRYWAEPLGDMGKVDAEITALLPAPTAKA